MQIRDRIKEMRRVPASSLLPNPKNWRTHPEDQKKALGGILEEVGISGATIVRELPDGSLQIIDGHLRAEVIGDGLVPVLVLDVTEEEADKILLTYDSIGSIAGIDSEKLSSLMSEIDFQSDAITEMLSGLNKEAKTQVSNKPRGGGDEFEVKVPEGKTRCKTGDLWIIGEKHRVICGDNTDRGVVDRLMAGKRVGLCFTSPPYSQQRDYGDLAKGKVNNWLALMCGTFRNIPMKTDGQVLVNLGLIHKDGEWVPYWEPWVQWMSEQGWRKFGWYVWDKTHALPGDFGGRFATSHEWIFHFNKESRDIVKCVEKKEESIRVGGGTGTRNQDGGMKGYRSNPLASLNTHKIPDSVFRMTQQMGGIEGHPAPYPVGLPSLALEAWPSDVYDPYMGSGTTMVAAHRLGHTAYGCEIEPKYMDVILRRAEAEGLTCRLADE